MKTVQVWVLAQWQIPEEMWKEEGDQIMQVMETDVKFAMASLSALDCGPVALKTRVSKGGAVQKPPTSDLPTKEEKTEQVYRNAVHYREVTGKRFRMTKEQKSRGLNRDEAFKEFMKYD